MPTTEVKKKIASSFEEDKNPAQFDPPAYTPEELEYRGYHLRLLDRAKQERDGPHAELDDKSYTTYYDDNAKAANSYNPPKENDEDTRINTGITRERGNTLLSSLLNYNFEANLTPYERSGARILGLGEAMENAVKKSREIEKYDEKRRLYYKELLDQGTGYVLEFKEEQIFVEKTIKDKDWTFGGVRPDTIKWTKALRKRLPILTTELIAGKDVYLGNMKEFFIQKQPFVFIRQVKTRERAKELYGDWDRWKNVPDGLRELTDEEQDTDFYNWRLHPTEKGWVEEIMFFDSFNNDFQIYLNGVQMLPAEFPLTFVSPSGLIPIAKGDTEPISRFFAISRSIGSKTEVDQKLMDSVLRMLVLKLQRSLIPPMANNTNKILSRKIFTAGSFTRGVNPAKLAPIGPVDGPSASEFNMFQLLRNLAYEKSIDPVFSGDDRSQKTATEAIQRKQQQMMKIGQAVIGIMEFEKQLILLRIYNILALQTQPYDERIDEARKEIRKVYYSFEIETTFKDTGKRGRSVVSFNPALQKAFAGERGAEKIKELQHKAKEQTGEEMRYIFLNGDELHTADLIWDLEVTPTEKNTTELERVLFQQNVLQAMQMFGPEALNMDYVKERFAINAKEDPEKFFRRDQGAPSFQGEQKAEGQPRVARELQSSTQTREPSLNTLV